MQLKRKGQSVTNYSLFAFETVAADSEARHPVIRIEVPRDQSQIKVAMEPAKGEVCVPA